MIGGIIKLNESQPPAQKMKVWSLYLENTRTNENLLHMCLAYDLESAIEHAWQFLRNNVAYAIADPKMYTPKMWLSVSLEELVPFSTPVLPPNIKGDINAIFGGRNIIDELVSQILKSSFPAEKKSEVKSSLGETNVLMQKIIKNKDSKLFKESMGKFTEQEKKYIQSKLKIKP